MADENGFGYKLKNELAAAVKASPAQKKALLYGLALFSRSFTRDMTLMQTEYECVAKRYCALLEELCNISATLRVSGGETPLFLL
ncbi:MAG: hypothetical protein ACERKO_13155, partial [Acetanaerobacterium sp.]